MPDMPDIAANVAAVRREIADACARCGRDPSTVRLIAVTKNQEPGVIEPLRQAGIRDFGENRVEHLRGMRTAHADGDRWHYIGRVQGRQLPEILPLCHHLHSLCDPGHVQRLARAAAGGPGPEVFLQVNASGEASKAGIVPAQLPTLLADARSAGLNVVGLMTMAPELDVHADVSAVRSCFATLRSLASGLGLARLSMGMSVDFPIAIEEGATDIRIGSRLFA